VIDLPYKSLKDYSNLICVHKLSLMKTPIKTKSVDSNFTISVILSLCRDGRLFKRDLHALQGIQALKIRQTLNCTDLDDLCKQLENHVYALWVISSFKEILTNGFW
jgi:hypothetical protein